MAWLKQHKQRVGVNVEGRVQGVGFRPAVYRYALENNLVGFVLNTTEGVYIEAEGDSSGIKNFLDSIKYHPPKQSIIKNISIVYSLPLQKEKGFRIEKSRQASPCGAQGGTATARTECSPDIAACKKCLKELFDPSDKRYLFPFINCTDCGPRFTITKSLPYDRKNTTMDRFMLCPDCYAEYINPLDRRFHAQPDCCFACGPEFTLFDRNNKGAAAGHDAIQTAAKLISEGAIVAVKGTGGYHLVCGGTNPSAIKTLRERKRRGDKPFALMAKDISVVEKHCIVNDAEKKVLGSWQTPVVLLGKKSECKLPEAIAPFNTHLGFFLPYAPVHHLLFFYGGPEIIVATSANAADEPIIFREDAASFKKLYILADYVLTNNRGIHTGCDDSVLKRLKPGNRFFFLRKARGYTPDPLATPAVFEKEVFAAGANEKNTFSFGRNREIITSQHTGTLNSLESFNFYRDIYVHFKTLFGFRPEVLAYDLHPDYITSRFAIELAEKEKLPALGIQHHHAHIASCMLENGLPDRKVIGVALDGTGYGEDGDIRGAEIMLAGYTGYQRFAYLDYVPLPGGEKAIEEVWRTGLSYLYKTFGEETFKLDVPLFRYVDGKKITAVKEMLENNINCPPASSMGRLFDAVSAITGIRTAITYDAQAAVETEMAAEKTEKRLSPYRFGIKPESGRLIIDPAPVIEHAVKDTAKGISATVVSYRFHAGVAEIITEICKKIKEENNISEAVLSGGVFQNALLLNMVCKKLKEAGFTAYVHKRLPANDGCISAGQAIIALYMSSFVGKVS